MLSVYLLLFRPRLWDALCSLIPLRYETAYKYPGLAFTTDLLFTFLGMRKRWASVWTPANSLFVFLIQGIRGLQVQFSSVAQSCPTLCDPMNHSTQGLPVHHQLPEFTQTHVHRVSDAIQPSHPLLSPFPPAPNPSQHQSLFQ